MAIKYNKLVRKKEYYFKKKNKNRIHLYSYLLHKEYIINDKLSKWRKINNYTIEKKLNLSISNLSNLFFFKKFKKYKLLGVNIKIDCDNINDNLIFNYSIKNNIKHVILNNNINLKFYDNEWYDIDNLISKSITLFITEKNHKIIPLFNNIKLKIKFFIRCKRKNNFTIKKA